MPGATLPRHLRILGRLAPRARAAALTAALPIAGPDEVGGIVAELLDLAVRSPETRTLTALAAQWPRLNRGDQTALRSLADGRWSQLAGELASDGFAPHRATLARLAGELPELALATCLPQLLDDGDAEVRAAAEGALVALAARAAATGAIDWNLAAETAVAGAVAQSGEHRSASPALALIHLASRIAAFSATSPIAPILADEAHEIHASVRRLIRRSPRDVSVAQAWRLLRHAPWAPACLERLAPAKTAGGRAGDGAWDEVLSLGQCIANPRRRAAFGRLRSLPWGVGAIEAMTRASGHAALTPLQRAAIPGLVDAVVVRPGDFDRLTAPLLTDPSPLVRYCLLRVSAARRRTVLPVLLDLCFDADARCARSAALLVAPWRRTGRIADPTIDAAARAMRRSPHAGIRRLAAHIPVDEAAWFTGHPRGRLAAREALRSDPDRVVGAIRRRLASGVESDAVAAAQLAAAVRIVAEVEIELLAVLRRTSNTGHAAATGASALGCICTPSSAEALHALLHSSDARVRANALDAIVRRVRWSEPGEPERERLAAAVATLLMDAHHRVRAGAIRAEFLLASRSDEPCAGAVAGLCAMLADERPMHRLAGLWLAERAAPDGPRDGWGEIACRVSSLFREDAEAVVRVRAGRCADALLARFRSDWAARAGGPAPAADILEPAR